MDEPTRLSHWVLIETGGTQSYIFGSNRLRHVVGASQLVHEVGTEWVPEAVRQLGLPEADTVVMTASGKALLLVRDAATGRAVIRAVTGRALDEAPGLRVTGAVGPPFDPADSDAYEAARERTYDTHRLVRAKRADPLVGDRVFPWHLACRDSGRPATSFEAYGTGDEAEWAPASAGVRARSAARQRADGRLRERLGDRAGVVPPHLSELAHSGWTAVLHADGNGVGGLFRGFVDNVARAEGIEGRSAGGAGVPLATYTRYQRDVARELDEATWAAVVDAVHALPGTPAELEGRLLPIVVGGDDVTVACDAALAVPFVRVFAAAFLRHTASQPTLSALTRAATGHSGLTASAGIAVIKPHHPFAQAYALAEELTVSAKRVTVNGMTLTGFDVHVAHNSTLRPLAQLREYLHTDEGPPIARHGGPYLLDHPSDLPGSLRQHSLALFGEVSDYLGADGWLSGAQAHALREAANRSLGEYEHHLALIVGRAEDPGRAHELLSVRRDGRFGPFLRLFDAMHLRGLRLNYTGDSTMDTESTRNDAQ